MLVVNHTTFRCELSAKWYNRKENPLALWRLGGFGDFRKKTAVFGCLTKALAPPPIALESCSTAPTDWPV